MSTEGVCSVGSHRYAHPEQPAGHVLAAEVRAWKNLPINQNKRKKCLSHSLCPLFCQVPALFSVWRVQAVESSGGQRIKKRQRETEHPDQDSAAEKNQRPKGFNWKPSGKDAPWHRPGQNWRVFHLQPCLFILSLIFQVVLPDRTCEVHRLKLSKDEKAVYDVVFAQSK